MNKQDVFWINGCIFRFDDKTNCWERQFGLYNIKVFLTTRETELNISVEFNGKIISETVLENNSFVISRI